MKPVEQKLPVAVTVELLKHMSEEGRFEQTLSDFPKLHLQEIRQTFAWLAEQVDLDPQEWRSSGGDVIREFLEKNEISTKTRQVLKELSPEEGYILLRNFGAVD